MQFLTTLLLSLSLQLICSIGWSQNQAEPHTPWFLRTPVDTLTEGKSYSFIYESIGCFHFYDDTWTVSNKAGKKWLLFRGKTYSLSGSLLEEYRQFERSILSSRSRLGCTTEQTYWLKIGASQELILRDGSCKLYLYSTFKKQLEHYSDESIPQPAD